MGGERADSGDLRKGDYKSSLAKRPDLLKIASKTRKRRKGLPKRKREGRCIWECDAGKENRQSFRKKSGALSGWEGQGKNHEAKNGDA